MAAIEPLPIEPPGTPDAQGWSDNITRIGTNLQNNAETIAQVPLDIAKGVSVVWNTVGGWFSDPAAPPQPAPPVIEPPTLSWVPVTDPFVTYSGAGVNPTWGDVYQWQQQTTHAQTPDVPQPSPISGAQVQHAIDVASGQTIKAIGGMINNAVDLQTLAADVLAQRIVDTQNVIGALTDNQALTNAQLHQILDLVVNGSLPQLWAEVNRLHAQIIGTAEGVLKVAQVWATDNIYKPLEEQLGQEKVNRIAQVDSVETGLAGNVERIVGTMGLASAAEVTRIAAQVATLAQESADCTQPMCDTMGPKTNLGKLLKALSLASEAAFIAELLAMNESDLVAFLQTVFGKVATVIDAVETSFLSGGETIGGFVKNTIESAT